MVSIRSFRIIERFIGFPVKPEVELLLTRMRSPLICALREPVQAHGCDAVGMSQASPKGIGRFVTEAPIKATIATRFKRRSAQIGAEIAGCAICSCSKKPANARPGRNARAG